jgi:cobalt-zinc-cadmium efflux system membrane fusion protein
MTQLPTRSFLIIALMSVVWASCAERHPVETAPAANARETAAASISAGGDRIQVPSDSPMLSQIRLATVKTEQVPTDVVDAPGKIEADPNRLSHVILPLAGRASSVLVHIGDTVQRGQTVLLLESPDADAATSVYVQSEAGINAAKSQVIKAQADYDRAKDLFQNSAIAQKDVLTAESALAQSKASLESAIAVREQAQRRLGSLGLKGNQYGQRIEVRAPIAGKVLELTIAPNEYRNDTNTSVMTIADLSEVWVSSDVPETKIRFIKVGEQIDLDLEAYPGNQFHARVARIADTVDPTTRTVKVHALLANPGGRLRPEMFGRIRHVESLATATVIPLVGIVQSEGQSYVYRESAPGVFDRVRVAVGNRLGDNSAITGDIKTGDRIVTDGVMLLKGQ